MADQNDLQNTAEWHEARKSKVTASRVGAILGHNPYQSADDTMREMVREYFGAEREFKGNVATEYGNKHEAEAIVDYMTETGNLVEDSGFIAFEDWAGFSPDGLIGEHGGLEIKCPYSKKFFTVGEKPYYKDQCLFSLACSGRQYWDFVVWVDGQLQFERLGIDEATKWASMNFDTLKEFHAKYLEIINDKKLAEPYLKDKELDLSGDAEYANLVETYKDLDQQVNQLTEQLKDVKAELINKAIDSDYPKITGCGLSVMKITKKGNVNYKGIPQLKGIDLDEYRGKETSYWAVK